MRLAGRFAGGCFAGGGPLRRLLLRGWRAAPQVVASRVAGRNVRSIFTLIVIFLAQPALGSQASVPGCFFCANDLCLLAFSFWRPADLLLCICCIATAFVHLLHRSGFCASVASQRLLRSGKLFRSDFRFAPSPRSAPGRQHLPDGSPSQRPGRQQTSFGGEDLRFG